MDNEILIALFAKMLDEKIGQLPVRSGQRGPRGRDGRDGRDFVFSEHESTIKAWAKEFALSFEDYTAEQIEALRGPRGKDGRDGKGFDLAEHEGVFRDLAEKFALKFEDLSSDQIEAVRGPRGRDGRDGSDGRSFCFEEHRNEIEGIIRTAVGDVRETLKLRFSDLTDEEIGQLRGPRGRDGRDGRDFVFDDYLDFFNGLRLKFSDLTDSEKDSLKLHFSQLSEEEKSSLKLRFEDLTDEDRALIRGPRGVRGQKGAPGIDGERGQMGSMGPRGLPGPMGLRGLKGNPGVDGEDGEDGEDAPRVVAIEVDEWPNGEVVFVFIYSDGTQVKSDRVKLPAPVHVTAYGGRSGGSVQDLDTLVDEANSTTTYVGYAEVGSLTSNAVWKIKRVLVSGTETIITYASSTWGFDKVWDDRASYTYG